MAIKNYSLAHVPGPKDRNRYKLNLACEEKDAHKLADKLGDISSRPFHSPDMSFDFSLFLYGVTREMKEKLLSQLKMLIDAQPEVSSTGEKKEEDEVRPGKLKPGYTFKKFVVGANTRFTYAACKAVAENPGKNYNPLFIYGGVGLGKTHLMQSIGNYALENFKGIKVVYISTQEFINEIIDAIEEGKIKDVREKYKKVDVLLIDDIQFLQQSEATQEEFFLIFNEMHDVGKQIVITSDKPPKQLVTLEDRLKSRFEWGLTADIKTPNFETRKAIFKKKAEEKGLKLEEKFVTYIAERLTSNIRELEGIINRISAYNKLSGDSIDFKLIKEIVSSVGNESGSEDESEEKKESPPAPPSQKQRAPEPDLPHPPPQTYFSPPPQQPPPAQMTPGCVYCGRNLVFIPQYRKWYCHGCGQYQDLPGMSHTAPAPFSPAAAPPGKKCAKCSAPMSYISRYDRFYCYNCREYDSEARERQEKDMAPPPPEEKKKLSSRPARRSG
ncbi:MAG: chromosomal replication initiator protein DnaA, partial [Elusimicrobiota bacterium]